MLIKNDSILQVSFAAVHLSENERSLELLSESLRFELEAFNAFRSVANDTTLQNNTDNMNNTIASIPGV